VSPPEFFDIAIDASPAASPSSCLEDKVPKTAENLHILSTGERGFDYKISCFHRIVLVNICRGGVFTCHNGTSGKFIYGEKIDESNIWVLTNSFQFFICIIKTEWLNGKLVVFDKMKENMNIVEAMECFESRNGKT
ncbi:hypothetical protein FD755_017712, partial [Muntiacus reevesi]